MNNILFFSYSFNPSIHLFRLSNSTVLNFRFKLLMYYVDGVTDRKSAESEVVPGSTVRNCGAGAADDCGLAAD